MKMHAMLYVVLFILNFAVNAETLFSYKVFSTNQKILEELTARTEIVAKENAGYLIYVRKENVQWFKRFVLKNNVRSQLLSQDINADLKNESFTNGYKKFADVQTVMEGWLKQYPENIKKIEYGFSTDKKPLSAYIFKSTGFNSNSAVKKVLITAATHGDELITVEVLLKQIEYILQNNSTDQRLHNSLKDKLVYFIPVVSPDSFERRERYVDGKDPNRAYPWPTEANLNQRVGVIDSLISFSDREKFSASLDLHAYGQMVMYPWGFTTKAPAVEDIPVFDSIVAEMSRENHYKSGQISTTIYVARGSSADYYYWKNKTKAIAVEIGKQKIPRIEKLPEILTETNEMFYRFFETI